MKIASRSPPAPTGLRVEEVESFARSLPTAPPEDVRDLLEFCSGIEGALEQIDFTGRTLLGFCVDLVIPYALPIAQDGCGNYWVVDLRAGSQAGDLTRR
jgi:hypothetical protein